MKKILFLLGFVLLVGNCFAQVPAHATTVILLEKVVLLADSAKELSDTALAKAIVKADSIALEKANAVSVRLVDSCGILRTLSNTKTDVLAFMGATSAQLTVLKNSTAWLSINGGTATTSETVAEYYVPFAGTLKNLYTYVSSSSTDANSTITIRKNGVSQTLEVTYTATQTGLQSNTSSSFTVAQGDRIAVKATNGSTAGGASKDLVLQSWSFMIIK